MSQMSILPGCSSAEKSDINVKSAGKVIDKKLQRNVEERGQTSLKQHDKKAKICQEKAMFPKIQAATIEINEHTQEDEDSPLSNNEKASNSKMLECEEAIDVSPSQASQEKERTFTPNDIGTENKPIGENSVSPDFSSHQGHRRTLSKKVKEDSKLNLNEVIEKQIQKEDSQIGEDFQRLKYEYSQANIKINQLAEQNREFRDELESRTKELTDFAERCKFQSAKIEELEDHNCLLQQQSKGELKLQSLRGAMLEKTVTERENLRKKLTESERRVAALESHLVEKEGQKRFVTNSTVS